jgi:hypothetical protein
MWVPHLCDSLIVAKVGIVRKHDRFCSLTEADAFANVRKRRIGGKL